MAMEKVIANATNKLKSFFEKAQMFLLLILGTIWIVGREDPRKLIHALKVGLSLTLVSLLYLMEPLFKGIGENTMWAVMTVVVVFEFTAGATLCKGLNRGFGTILAGLLAFVIGCIADKFSQIFQAIFIAATVFAIGAASTYVRFIPIIKKNYDYGVLIFLLTFNLITVSSYRVDNVLNLARERFYTIALGCGVCLLMSLLVFPNWSGEELHNSIISKIEGLAQATQACVNEYFNDHEIEETDEDSSTDHIYKCYGAVLDSKSTEESLARHASWEPRHLRQCRYPWKQYVKLGSSLRHFGYTIVALHGCLQTEIQTPKAIRALFKDPCIQLASELSEALKQLAQSIKSRHQCSPEALSERLQEALRNLNDAFKSHPKIFLSPNTSLAREKSGNDFGAGKRASEQGDKKVLKPMLSKIAITSLEFSESLPFAAFASLLVEAVARLDLVVEEVEELGRIANFKDFQIEKEFVNFGKHSIGKSIDIQSHFSSHGAE